MHTGHKAVSYPSLDGREGVSLRRGTVESSHGAIDRTVVAHSPQESVKRKQTMWVRTQVEKPALRSATEVSP